MLLLLVASAGPSQAGLLAKGTDLDLIRIAEQAGPGGAVLQQGDTACVLAWWLVAMLEWARPGPGVRAQC
jgi:hypothetical protein